MSRNKVISKFERLLFNGVPEQPEYVFQRNSNAIAMNRKRGMPAKNTPKRPQTDTKRTGYIEYDLEKGICNYISTLESPE